MNFKSPSFEETTSKEFLVTNGLGGYASSSICGANTRRYHGLLVASLNPPTDRVVLVSKVEETIEDAGGKIFQLSSNQYPASIYPQGFQYLSHFERKPLPKSTFIASENILEKTVFMAHGSNTTIAEYANTGNSVFTLYLNPLFVSRDYHQLFHENPRYDFYFRQITPSDLVIYPHYGAQPLYFSFTKGNFKESRSWYKNFQYEIDRQRGQDFSEDACSIGSVRVHLEPGEKVYLTFTLDQALTMDDPERLKQAELARLTSLVPKNINSEFLRDLLIAGDQFLVHRKSTDSATIIAGYHWFTDWGRDTMIALRGLCISAGRFDEAKSILKTFFRHLDKGMLPNRFPDNPRDIVEYNTIDAALWLFVVMFEYYQKTFDLNFIREHFTKLEDIIRAHIEGTRYNIKVTPEGLLAGGSGTDQLTWMDARVDGYVVTPRHGCPVEINALWYNALMIHGYFAKLLRTKNESHAGLADRARNSFRKYFMNSEGYLHDVVVPGKYEDHSARPNQIYAVSLPFPLLTLPEERAVLAKVAAELFTPFGLRSLSPTHPDFRPMYDGNAWQRDTSYHQGTVWPFLIGEFFIAQLKVSGNTLRARREVAAMLTALQRHFYDDNCLHGISEIFDGATPATGKGATQQAWSVSMLIKVMMDYRLDEFFIDEKTSEPLTEKITVLAG